jgi:hypothetical protein
MQTSAISLKCPSSSQSVLSCLFQMKMFILVEEMGSFSQMKCDEMQRTRERERVFWDFLLLLSDCFHCPFFMAISSSFLTSWQESVLDAFLVALWDEETARVWDHDEAVNVDLLDIRGESRAAYACVFVH